MKINAQKGPTITPALIPVQNAVTGQTDLVGFIGLSELDYVSTHIAAAIVSRQVGPDPETIAKEAVTLALEILRQTNEVAQRRNNSPDLGAARKPFYKESDNNEKGK